MTARTVRVVGMAVALAFMAVLAATTRAGGQPRPAPASVPLYSTDGLVRCRAARFDGGAYGARHCAGPRTVNGTPAASSIDPTRDLRHYCAMPAAGVGLRPAVAGETLTWANDRGAGEVEVQQTGQDRGTFTFRVRAGATPTFGESGTGLYGADGSLVGVLVELHFDEQPGPRGTPVQIPNGLGWAVQVP